MIGDSQCDVYKYLTGELGKEPPWNFCKYPVDRTGEPSPSNFANPKKVIFIIEHAQ